MGEETVRVQGGEAGVNGELRAVRFTLVDRAGRTRGALGPADDGASGLLLYDALERPRAQMVLDPSGAANVKLHDRDGDVAAWLSVGRTGAPSLYLRGVSRRDQSVRGHAEVCVDEHGCPVLSLHDREGQTRVLLTLDERDGRPTLSFSDGQGNSRMVLSEDAAGSLLYLYDRPDDAPPADGVPRLTLGPAVRTEGPRGEQPVRVAAAPEPRLAEGLGSRLSRLERAQRRRRIVTPLLLLLAALAGGVGSQLLGSDLLGELRLRPRAEAPVVATAAEPAAPTDAPAAAQPSSSSVSAEEFVVRDAKGEIRARLALLPDGWPYLQLNGPEGEGVVQLAVLPGPDVLLRLGDGRSTLSLNTAPDGPPAIGLYEGDRVIFQAPAGVSRFPPPSIWP